MRGKQSGSQEEGRHGSSFNPHDNTARGPLKIIYSFNGGTWCTSGAPDEGFRDEIVIPTQGSGSRQFPYMGLIFVWNRVYMAQILRIVTHLPSFDVCLLPKKIMIVQFKEVQIREISLSNWTPTLLMLFSYGHNLLDE